MRKILFCISLICLLSCKQGFRSKLLATQGELDLKSWDYSQSTIQLSGEWEFHPNEFLISDSLADSTVYKFVFIPRDWDSKYRTAYPLYNSNASKRGSLRLKIYLPNNAKDLSIRLPYQDTTYRIYIDGKLLANVQKSDSNNTDFSLFLGAVVKTIPLRGPILELVLEIEDIGQIDYGIWNGLQIGSSEIIFSNIYRDVTLEISIASSVFVLSLYHFGIFLTRRKSKAPLYFAIFCFAAAIRVLFINNRSLDTLFPEISSALSLRVEYISTYTFGSLLYIYAAANYRKEFHRFTIPVALTFLVFFVGIAVISPMQVYTKLLLPFEVFLVLGCIYVLGGSILAVLRKREGALIFLVGICVILLAAINDLLFNQYLIQTASIILPAFFIFIFMQSFAITLSFSRAYNQSENVSKELKSTNRNLNQVRILLERNVESRTKELREAKERAEEEARYRYEFLATMSHEVRTPLNGLMGTAN
ncbi:7TM-DISM domain-containing protein, partial [Leptospira perolatii]